MIRHTLSKYENEILNGYWYGNMYLSNTIEDTIDIIKLLVMSDWITDENKHNLIIKG